MKNKKVILKNSGTVKEVKKKIAGKENYFSLLIPVVLTFLVFIPILNNGFVNWDENTYIVDNLLIRSININKFFTTYQIGNYHPITMLVYAIEYHFFGLKENGYHAVSLLLHLLNVTMVYFCVWKITKVNYIALIAALLFGIHPIHVESVAWAAELKDLLYTFFFLCAFLSYIKYTANKNLIYYFTSIALFIFSLLSKGMAVPFPVVLILTDYFTGRGINKKTILEKIPFLLLAIAAGLIAIDAQKYSNAVADVTFYEFPKRIIFACYAFITYLRKIIFPVDLSAFYPYPVKYKSPVPLSYYIYPVLLIAFIAGVLISLRRGKKIIFGVGFFTATVFLVLQLLPVGNAVMADRYAYLSSVGIFYLAGEGFHYLKRNSKNGIAISLLVLYTIVLSLKTIERCGVWKDAYTLWSDVISKNDNIPFAYNNRGGTFMKENKADKALQDFNKAIELQPEFSDALNNRGILYYNEKKYNEALKDFNKALKNKIGLFESYNNRGLVLMALNRHEESLADFNKAITLKNDYAQAFYNRGLLEVKENKTAEAFNDYSTAIKLIPGYIDAHINRAVLFQNQKRFEEALSDYQIVLNLQPENPQVYYNKGLILMEQKKFDDAINCFSKAIEFKSDNGMLYYSKGMAEYYAGKTGVFCEDFQKAISLGYDQGINAYNEYCH